MWMFASELTLFAVMLIAFSNSNDQFPSGSPLINISRLLPFGNGTNDIFGPSRDDSSSPPLMLWEPFIFFGKQYRKVVVNSNGILLFSDDPRPGFITHRPRPFPFSSSPFIAPFWADFDPSAGGHIFYRQTNDSALLQAIHLLVMGLNDESLVSFYPTHLFIATWDNVPPFLWRRDEEYYNTFQVVLATDATNTVAVFIYDDIQWERNTQIGFNFGDGENSFTVPEIYLDQLLNISDLTNIGQRGIFVFRLDNINVVECSTSVGCMTSDLGVMFHRECCISTPEGLAYTMPGSDICYVCIVFGWLNDSFTGVEQEESHVINVGYQKGAEQVGFNVIFDIVVQQPLFGRENSDVIINPEVVQIFGTSPVHIEVTFRADNVALEMNETVTFGLVPSGRVSLLSGEGIFFHKTLTATIIDMDVLDVHLSEGKYQATESDTSIEVSVCKNKRISLNTPTIHFGVSTDTILNKTADTTLLSIPIDNPLSPNRADLEDFESILSYVSFFQDEDSFDQSEICKSTSITIINDAVNEADQFFIIQLSIEILDYRIDPKKITLSQNISLGWIIDDDPIRIGFELPSYTFLEPPFEDQIQIFLKTEDNRQSEQTFKVSFDLTTLNSSDLYQPAVVDEDFVVANRTISALFPPFTQRIPYQFTLLPDHNLQEVESFSVMSSNSWDDGDQFPMYLPPNSYVDVATIIIIDAENTIGFSQELVTIWEDQGVAQITIFSYGSIASLDHQLLNFTTYGGNATEGKDYEGIFQKYVQFVPNDSSIIIEIKIFDDNLAEGVEIFFGELVMNGPTHNFTVTINIEILDDEERGVCGNMIANQTCSEDASCEVLNGRILASCSCNDGFLGNGFICQDIDECNTGEDNCDTNAICSNVHGSHKCHCNDGFFGNGTLCITSTNQVPGPCRSNNECTCFGRLNATSAVVCGCLPGYNLTVNRIEGIQFETCYDINECDHSPCGIGTCINTDGSFYCLCPAGYFFDDFGCIDLNECKLGQEVHGCNRNAECKNTNGSFTCYCKDGFVGDGIICRNRFQECNSRNTESCGCSSGYYFEPKSRLCQDVNECEMYNSFCDKNARCVNTPGSFMCQCSDGFQGSGTICNDINECDTGLHDCDVNAFCINNVGGFTCSCQPLFFGNGRECRLGISPKIISPSIIPARPNHNLSYTIGTDFCLEDSDSFPDGVIVHCPISDAAIPHPHFYMSAVRAAANGSITAQLLGRRKDYLSLDMTTLSALFDNDTVFVNITCSVYNFFGNDERTSSITVCGPTECQDGVTNNCSQTCTRSSVHVYKCGCNDGYLLNMDICVDIDECVDSSTHNCSEIDHEICRNLEGSYVCDCSSGFERQGNVCEGLNFGSGLHGVDIETRKLKNINECVKMIDNCTDSAMCLNTFGSFTCLCMEGYDKVNELCIDINECSRANTHTCFESNHQVCINTLGSYVCECVQGFARDSNNICNDLNECKLFNGNCSQLCNNTDGSYYCDCENGFVLDIQDYSTCHDINECKVELHNCHSNAVCINTLGSFNCRCKSHYEGDGVTCKVSETVVIGSALGVGSILLFFGILLIVLCICCCIWHSLHIVRKKNVNLSPPECGYPNGDNLSPLIFRTESDASEHERELRTFSVQSSYKLQLPPYLIIPSTSIKLVELIGQGEFGIVYKGHIIKGRVVTKIVAIKTLKGFYDSAAVKQMLKECSKMHIFKHPNVLTLIGVCLDGGPNPFIIMPFMANGSLLTYLKKHRGKLVVSGKDHDVDEVKSATKQLMDMCLQVAKGMKYLADKQVVHRDLAARNCMIDINFVIKVADFGLSESVGTKKYFRQDKSSIIKLPLKWLAPESMEDYVFSEKSDVWAYGVTCWEIFNGGKVPYPSVDLTDLPRLLANGQRLEKPDNDACNNDMYTSMLQCWEFDPHQRPSFSSLVESLSKYLEAVADYIDFGSKSMDTECVESNGAFLEKVCSENSLEESQSSMPDTVQNT